MSGNVWEWCFDLDLSGTPTNRLSRGGAYYSDYSYVQMGFVYSLDPNYDDSGTQKMGLRLAQSE
jgi:formylglycine-generating enzyme required for sulfatase activity